MKNRQTAKEFVELVVKIKQFMRSQYKGVKDNNFTQQQFRTLIYLKKLNKSSLKVLSENVYVSKSSLCIMLNKMVDEDLVIRETDKNDRRNTLYSLSAKGEDFLTLEMEKRLKNISDEIEKLDDELKGKFYNHLKELNEIMNLFDEI